MGWMRMSRVVLVKGMGWACLSCPYIVGLGWVFQVELEFQMTFTFIRSLAPTSTSVQAVMMPSDQSSTNASPTEFDFVRQGPPGVAPAVKALGRTSEKLSLYLVIPFPGKFCYSYAPEAER